MYPEHNQIMCAMEGIRGLRKKALMMDVGLDGESSHGNTLVFFWGGSRSIGSYSQKYKEVILIMLIFLLAL